MLCNHYHYILRRLFFKRAQFWKLYSCISKRTESEGPTIKPSKWRLGLSEQRRLQMELLLWPLEDNEALMW